MKVLNVNVLLDPISGGGTAERTFQMSKAQASLGFECVILTTDIGLTEDRVKSLSGIKVVSLPCLFKRFFVVRFSYAQIKSLISNADVIHLMGHWSMLNVLVYYFAKRTRTPYVICPAGELSLFGRSRWVKRLFNFTVGNRVVRDAAGYVAVTPDEVPVFGCYGIKPERITIIPNGVNEQDFQPSEIPSFSEQFEIGNNPFILFMGRLNPIKGPDLLLDAFCLVMQKFPELHLVFAGPDGGLLSILKQTVIKEKAADRVHFVGYLAGKDKANAYQEASWLVIPSRQEAMSIVVLEAGILGTPVLLTDQCGFDEVEHIGGGLVVPATVTGLENGLLSLLGNLKESKVMGKHLKSFVRQKYTWQLICKDYIKLYQCVLRNANKTL